MTPAIYEALLDALLVASAAGVLAVALAVIWSALARP